MTEAQIARFWAKVSVRGANQCWPWKAMRLPGGYGLFRVGPNKITAQRVAFIVTNGEIPSGYHVCHTCDNPPCCNPAHLWLGTPKDNNRDMIRKGRNNQSGSKLNPELVRAIREEPGSTREVAAKYGISHVTVWEIRVRRIWDYVE